MDRQQLRQYVIEQIKLNRGKIPLTLTIDGKKYNWNGGQRIGQNQLLKYRLSSEIYYVKNEKQIVIPLELVNC